MVLDGPLEQTECLEFENSDNLDGPLDRTNVWNLRISTSARSIWAGREFGRFGFERENVLDGLPLDRANVWNLRIWT